MRHERLSSEVELYRPLSIVKARPSTLVSSREVGRGGVKFMGRTISGGLPTTALYPEDRDWGYHDDGTTVYLVYNRLGVITYVPIAVPGSGVLAVASTSTSPYTVTDANDVLLVDATAGNITVNLHAVATARKKYYNFKKMDASANLMILDGAGGETIDSAATFSTGTQFANYTLFPTGTEWVIL